MIDYARPCMLAETALKNAHNAMLEKDYDEAIGEALTALAETKLMINSIREMKDRDHALRQQTQTL